MKEFDAIIIGTGQAGPSIAARCAAEGLKTAIIERDRFGGTCVNTGCTPTKALVASARVAHMARRSSDFGIGINGEVSVDMKSVKARKDKMRPFLVACAYEALKNIFLESSGGKRPLETMTSGDRCVLMQYSPQTMVVMVVESPSHHFRNSLKAFQDEFEQMNKGRNWNNLKVIEYEEALYNNFPYLKNLEVIETDEDLI